MFKKGNIPWNKGIPRTKHERLTMSRAVKNQYKNGREPWNKGKKRPAFSKKWLKNLSLAHRGKPHSFEWNKAVSESLRGKNHYAYRGDAINRAIKAQIRKLFEYRYWRKAIFERDNYTCVICKKRGGSLEVDHYPESFAGIIKRHSIVTVDDARHCAKLWDVRNGRTVCKKCHLKTENHSKHLINQ